MDTTFSSELRSHPFSIILAEQALELWEDSWKHARLGVSTFGRFDWNRMKCEGLLSSKALPGSRFLMKGATKGL